MKVPEKLKEIGTVFYEDLQILTDIALKGKEQNAKIYIDSLGERKRKIVAADTYLTIFYTKTKS